jgi:xanthine dehydrogenase YagR molybdenum-binding subunit
MTTTVSAPAIGAPVSRLEARAKVTGEARYAFEHSQDGMAYASIVQAPIAVGEVRAVAARAVLDMPGVLAVITHENAPALQKVDDGELAVLQTAHVSYRGQVVGVVVAETPEIAREGADRLKIDYDEQPHDVLLRADHPALYKPETVNAGFATDTEEGDPDAALAAAAVAFDATYETPAFHNNPIEPHASVARWDDGDLTVYDSTQGAPTARGTLAKVFDLPPERVRVISHHVGGGFGSKGTPRPSIVSAAIAAKLTGRPVKLAVTRQQMFALTGYRTPTIQRLRLGAAPDGTLTAIVHDAISQSSTIREFTEQTATPTRTMYAAANRRTTHRLARLDVPTPSWLRAPGECPGMYGLECAMDELAVAAGIDPIELRVRNEPALDPEKGIPFSSRNLVACLHEGADRFGWADRDPTPRARREGEWLVGTGVASSTYPAYRSPAQASARAEPRGGYVVRIGAADIGTGARTVLTQIAADALEVPIDQVRVEIGDSALPRAGVAGGSMGTSSWGSAVVMACKSLLELLAEHGGDVPPEGLEAEADTAEEVKARAQLSRHAFGAQFAEARVNAHTGEVRIARMLGVFAAGRIINPKTARSQLIGGMTMGISMALHEESVMDAEFGDYLNHDLAGYHVAANADIHQIDAYWIDEHDDQLNPMGSKGIGEIGIVGTAAAVANAVFHATGQRIRRLPIQPDALLA